MTNNYSLTPFKIFCNIAPELARHMITSGSCLSADGIYNYLMACDLAFKEFKDITDDIQKEIRDWIIPVDDEKLGRYEIQMYIVNTLYDDYKSVHINDPFLRKKVEELESQKKEENNSLTNDDN